MRQAKLTKNRECVQMIIPREYCDKYGFRSGLEILVEARKDGLLLRAPKGNDVHSQFWTIGYEGMAIDDLVGNLRDRGITQLIDVRKNPISRKAGFSKAALGARLEKEGLIYRHMPDLGSPNAIRNDLRNGGSLDSFFDQYSAYLESQSQVFDELRGLVMVRPSVLMCFEKDFRECHRKILAERLFGFGLKPLHI
ncbi:hypothetical protein DSECCO2_414170 [anaerobic digester metagenome]|jgi:uncharacterized protein (DUF488 family)